MTFSNKLFQKQTKARMGWSLLQGTFQ